jgi:hypothetical protein
VYLISDNENGVKLDGARVGPLDVWLGPVFVKRLTFKFLQSQNLWEGGAALFLPGTIAIGGTASLHVPFFGDIGSRTPTPCTSSPTTSRSAPTTPRPDARQVQRQPERLPAAEANPRASAAGSPQAFTLPTGLPSAMVRITGSGAPPDVTLSG